MGHAGIGATQVIGQAGRGIFGEPADMHFINNRTGERMAGECIILPVVMVHIDNDIFSTTMQIGALLCRALAIIGFTQQNATAIWIKKHFLRIKPITGQINQHLFYPPGVKLPCRNTTDMHMPVIAGTINFFC